MASLPETTASGSRWTLGLGDYYSVWLTVVFGAFVLLLAVFDEPLHIDEIRQISSYRESAAKIVELSFAQTQPPLDYWLGALFSRAFGDSDTASRLLPSLFGVASMVLVGLIFLEMKAGALASLPVLALATSPILVLVTAYARPYALPVFLSLLLSFVLRRWMTSGSKSALAGYVLVACIYPLSKTVEPLVFLSSVAALASFGALVSTAELRSRFVAAAAGSVLALLTTGLWVVTRVAEETRSFTGGDAAILDRMMRLFTEWLPAIQREVPGAPVLALLSASALLWKPTRRLLSQNWWLLPHLAVPIGFALAFFLKTRAGQPFYSRYVYSVAPAMSMVVGVTAAAATQRLSVRRARELMRQRSSLFALILLIAVCYVLAVSGAKTALELTHERWRNYATVSAMVQENTPENSMFLYDRALPFNSYRTHFRTRYLTRGRVVVSAREIVERPKVPADRLVYILLDGKVGPLPGWVPFSIHRGFTLLAKPEAVAGAIEAADTFALLGKNLPGDVGVYPLLAAAALYQSEDDEKRARRTLELALERSSEEQISSALARSPLRSMLPNVSGSIESQQ